MTAGQWLDWAQYDRQFHVAVNRDDRLWATARADFINANLPEHEFPVTWQDDGINPYHDPTTDDPFAVEVTREGLLEKTGLARLFAKLREKREKQP